MLCFDLINEVDTMRGLSGFGLPRELVPSTYHNMFDS